MGQDLDTPGWARALVHTGRFLVALPRAFQLLLLVSWMGLIWSLSAQTIEAPPEVNSALWSFCANLAHAPLFGILALLLVALLLHARPADDWPRLQPAVVVTVLVLVLAWALTDEWHQSRTPGRDSSLYDVVTDLVGASSVLFVIAVLDPPRTDERALRRRLLGGLIACLASAAFVAFH